MLNLFDKSKISLPPLCIIQLLSKLAQLKELSKLWPLWTWSIRGKSMTFSVTASCCQYAKGKGVIILRTDRTHGWMVAPWLPVVPVQSQRPARPDWNYLLSMLWVFCVFTHQVSNLIDFPICRTKKNYQKNPRHPQRLLECFKISFISSVAQTPSWFVSVVFMLVKMKNDLLNSLSASWRASCSASTNTSREHLYIPSDVRSTQTHTTQHKTAARAAASARTTWHVNHMSSMQVCPT